ncbi:MAG: hypothetical protein H6810_07260 [Phycisphaeraceae bacterium]|nr:MAG: hypothetical protein H6810_07260 [Phycisphaeraceae bacterium]
MELRKFLVIGASSLALFSGGVASAAADCCSATYAEHNYRGEVIEGFWCSSFWSSSTRQVGKFCLPLGSGYACGIQNTLTVGQEFELNASFTIGGDAGGVTVGAAAKYTVSQAFQHTAGPCESCQLYASYDGAVLRQWNVQEFCITGDSTYTRSTFYTYGAPTIQPCCEPNTSCPGCHGSDNIEQPIPDFWYADPGGPSPAEPGVNAPRGPGLPAGSFIVDLREPWTFSPAAGLPAWHPMNAPGSTFATLNDWQRREIMREVHGYETVQGGPLALLVVFDVDGTPYFFDLVTDPGGLAPCDGDTNIDGLLDLRDVNLFIDYFLFGDPSVDFDGNNIIDLVDLVRFTSSFVAGCP